MTYTDYQAEASEHRRQVSRCYYESRKAAKDAAKYYADAQHYQHSVGFFTRHPEMNQDNEAAAFEKLVRSTIKLADTMLNSSFNSMERAKFYAQLARDYDELHARREERLAL